MCLTQHLKQKISNTASDGLPYGLQRSDSQWKMLWITATSRSRVWQCLTSSYYIIYINLYIYIYTHQSISIYISSISKFGPITSLHPADLKVSPAVLVMRILVHRRLTCWYKCSHTHTHAQDVRTQCFFKYKYSIFFDTSLQNSASVGSKDLKSSSLYWP